MDDYTLRLLKNHKNRFYINAFYQCCGSGRKKMLRWKHFNNLYKNAYYKAFKVLYLQNIEVLTLQIFWEMSWSFIRNYCFIRIFKMTLTKIGHNVQFICSYPCARYVRLDQNNKYNVSHTHRYIVYIYIYIYIQFDNFWQTTIETCNNTSMSHDFVGRTA
jgi:hypothetical protein